MATDDTIQYLETTTADGTALGGAEMHRRQVETFLAGGAIAAGDIVAWESLVQPRRPMSLLRLPLVPLAMLPPWVLPWSRLLQTSPLRLSFLAMSLAPSVQLVSLLGNRFAVL
jgi:hypothetical protein